MQVRVRIDPAPSGATRWSPRRMVLGVASHEDERVGEESNQIFLRLKRGACQSQDARGGTFTNQNTHISHPLGVEYDWQRLTADLLQVVL